MEMCEGHFDALKQKIRNAGLWHTVSKDKKEAKFRATLASGDPLGFDALMAAHNMILGNFVHNGIITEGCPICAFPECEEWLGNSLGETIVWAKELGIDTRYE